MSIESNPVNIGVALGVCHDCLSGEHWECDDRNCEAVANDEESNCPCFDANHGRPPSAPLRGEG